MGRTGLVWMVAALALMAATPSFALTKCDLTFDLESWSVFYKEGHGRGVVDCDNGQRADVVIEAKGAGVSFGASKIVDGNGEFSLIADLNDIYGDYATAEAHAGMGPSTHAQIVTKGPISLALSGTGNGVDVGFAFGRFTIRRGAPPQRRAEQPPAERAPDPAAERAMEGAAAPAPERAPEAASDPAPASDTRARDDRGIDDEDIPSSDPVPAGGY